jgi:carbonic anhydrase/acetyltransferase-like protein (isoleucine patch superfamily)
MLYRLGSRAPVLAGRNFIAGNASVIGDVYLGTGASVWFNAVIRADIEAIVIGDDCNIQDHALLHVDHGMSVRLGRGVSVAHHAALHGCEIGDFTLVGLHAVVLNGARLGHHCVVGANTLVPEKMVVPDGSLVFGTPGRVLKRLDERECAELERLAALYRDNADTFLAELQPLALAR